MARDDPSMQGRRVALGLGFIAAAILGCSGSESPTAATTSTTTTTVASTSSSTTATAAPAAIPEPAGLTREERVARLRARSSRVLSLIHI